MVNFRYGPVDLIAAAFDGDVPDPSVLAVIADLVDAGQIRVLDLLIVHRGADGELSYDDLDRAAPVNQPFAHVELLAQGIIAHDDAEALVDDLAPSSSATVIAIELTWATRLASQLATVGGAVLETSVELSIERGEQVWVIMLDLDNFKRLNDTMGHDIGDLALQRAAASLKASIRSNDFCGRFGGEEFLAIIRGAEREDVAQIAERVRASIEDALAEYSSSASIGVALHHVPDSPQDVVNAADQAMYRAKTSGKNRVVLYDEESDSAAAAA